MNIFKGGYNLIILRFAITFCFIIILVLIPFLGLPAAVIVVPMFATFAAVKITQFQERNPESEFKHLLAMDKLYGNGKKTNEILKSRRHYYKLRPDQKTLSVHRAKISPKIGKRQFVARNNYSPRALSANS